MSTLLYKITPQKVKDLRKKVLAFYRTQGRHDLLWRQTTDPYLIIVSEVMLQQTQVSRVIPKYQAFIRVYPTVQYLARAGQRRLLGLWSGLGYNRRALMLRKMAQAVVRDHGGKMPTDVAMLKTLPGVGPYTAAAICAFAYNQNVVAIDTNIRRIFIHELGLPTTVTSDELERVALQVLPHGKSRIWHNALMDYGALLVTARKTGIAPVSQQSKFKGSDRQYRGQIMRELLRAKTLMPAALRKTLGLPLPRFEKIITQLVADGLVERVGRQLRLPR